MNQRYNIIREYVNRHARGKIADLGIGKLGERLGTILEIRKFPDHWVLYVRNI